MKIRNMTINDYESVDRLMKQVHNIHVQNRPDLYIDLEHPYSEQQFTEMLSSDNVISVLAEDESTVAGICFVSLRDKTCMVYKRTAYMDDLCIDINYRNMGIGTMLFKYVEQEAKNMGAERIDLMVWSFNESAICFYEQLGMKPQRFIMEKQL